MARPASPACARLIPGAKAAPSATSPRANWTFTAFRQAILWELSTPCRRFSRKVPRDEKHTCHPAPFCPEPIMSLSRRELFSCLFRPLQARQDLPPAPAPTDRRPRAQALAPGQTAVAVVQGRFCLAYQRSFCSTCSERCPVPGAIRVENGLPRVDSEHCTGCGVCQELCPAPTNAILLIPRRTPAARPSLVP
jgi:Pyruvate/2-oxoacid:ferredoxin oxidoreductase delta subunit